MVGGSHVAGRTGYDVGKMLPCYYFSRRLSVVGLAKHIQAYDDHQPSVLLADLVPRTKGRY